ncbi:FAD-dependent monooxygenase [Amycolatopsis minnesotensis]|uniref:FAD-dependent monooxygenase n=1 Tax=Amycolatopsis minnesotensis TaxID=337894 RepID=A0ABP5BWU8_9PSEU
MLVAGAGPVGLAAAYELTRRGVRVRVVDRADGPATTSRATATHARTLEIYHQMGILGDLLPRGQRAENFTMHRNGRVLARLGTDYSTLPTRFPFTLQVDQVITEEVLRERLHSRGVPVEWGVALEDIDRRADGAAAWLRRADGSVEEQVVPWLIGADGAHSTVRARLGFELLGESTETWLVADAVLDADLPRDSLHWLHTGDGTLLLVPFPDHGKWRLLDTVDVDSDDPDVVAARFARKISRALGRPVEVCTPSWLSVFTIQQRMIQRMRAGRCFVAGDAAHVHSPASGQGMNTGIQDAVNLAWKLADVIRGHAGEALLDSYAAERVPVGEVLLGTTKTATALIALRNAAAPVLLPLGLGVLNAVRPLKHRVERKIMRTMSGLALSYPDSPLSLPGAARGTGYRQGDRVGCSERAHESSAGWRALCTELTDPRWTLLGFGAGNRAALEHIDRRYGAAVSVRTVMESTVDYEGPWPLADPGDVLRDAFGARDGEFALIRPDGYLAGTGPLGDGRDAESCLRAIHLLPKEHSPAR